MTTLTQTQLVAILERARERVADDWTTGLYGHDPESGEAFDEPQLWQLGANGTTCPVCALGAIAWAAGAVGVSLDTVDIWGLSAGPYKPLSDAICRYTGGVQYGVATFNDSATQDEVVAIFDAALAELRS